MPNWNRALKARSLERRVEKKWWKVSDFMNKVGVVSSASGKAYRSFISTFPRIKVGRFSAGFSQVQGESLVALTFRTTNKRQYVGIRDRKFKIPSIPIPCQPFKARFVLAAEIEPQINHSFQRKKGACVITGLIGPGKRYEGNIQMINGIKEAIGGPWQNYLVKQLVEHAKSQGLGAVALLRPEHNPFLSDKYLIEEAGLSKEEAEQTRSAFFAAARKNKMKKVKGSKYFWIYF